MSYRCEQCEQTTTVGDVLNGLFKIGIFAGVAYMAFNFRNEIKGAVQSVIKKGAQMSGTEENGTHGLTASKKRQKRKRSSEVKLRKVAA